MCFSFLRDASTIFTLVDCIFLHLSGFLVKGTEESLIHKVSWNMPGNGELALLSPAELLRQQRCTTARGGAGSD